MLNQPQSLEALPTSTVSPEDYPSLSKYFEAEGKIEFTTFEQTLLARNLYVVKNTSANEVAKQLGVKLSVIKHWITIFEWEDERDDKLFHTFREVNKLRKKPRDLERRSDNLLARIEDTVKEILDAHDDRTTILKPKDLKTLADLVSNSYGTRKIISNGGNPKATEVKVTHTVTPELVGDLAGTLRDTSPVALENEHKLTVELGLVQDAEFEVKQNDEEL